MHFGHWDTCTIFSRSLSTKSRLGLVLGQVEFQEKILKESTLIGLIETIN